MKRQYCIQLSSEEIKAKIQEAFASYGAKFHKYAPKMDWISDSEAALNFRALGTSISVAIRISYGKLEIESRLPLRMRPFASLAVNTIDKEIDAWLRKDL
jgi:hypothetical protein